MHIQTSVLRSKLLHVSVQGQVDAVMILPIHFLWKLTNKSIVRLFYKNGKYPLKQFQDCAVVFFVIFNAHILDLK